MKTTRSVVASRTVWFGWLLVLGCDAAIDEPVPPPQVEKRSNVTRVELPVPKGQKVACSDLVPNVDIYSEAIGDAIGEVRDVTKKNRDATSVCQLHRAGTPPKPSKNPRKFAKLGVLPGDEYCTVTAYCSVPNDSQRLQEKCEKDGLQGNNAVGVFACVRKTQRGPDFAYTYKVLDPDTRCTLEIMGGPSVTDELLVQNCTRAAVSGISVANIGNRQ